MSLGKIAVAAATFASVTLLSFGASGPNGVSLSITSAQAQEQEQAQDKAQPEAREGRAMPSKGMRSRREMTSEKDMTSREMTSRRAARMPRDERRAARRVERLGRLRVPARFARLPTL